MTMNARVLVVGAINVDLVVAAERLPGPGETVVGPSVQRYGGGKGANSAVAASRAGAEVRYCGAVGGDDVGASALAELRAEGVDVADVAVLDETTTGMALIVVDRRGENQIAVGAGANAAVTPDTVRAAVARAAGWADCLLVSAEIPPEAVVAAVVAAEAHGIRCVLNPAPVLPELLEALPCGPVVTPNASELAALHALMGGAAGASVPEIAEAIRARTEAPVVVTLGAAGVLVSEPGKPAVALPAGEVAEVSDTTGAGDTFNGVLAAALARGASVLEASTRGVAAASLSVAAVGARSGMPRAEAIDAALA